MSARLSRLRAMLRRWRRGAAASDRALDEEIASALQHEIDARVAAGMPPVEAQRAARAAFGSLDPIREHVRDARTGAFGESIARDVRYAWRGIRRSPGLAMGVIGSLAIGLAVTVAAMAFVRALMFGGYPGVSDQQRLVQVGVIRAAGGNSPESVMRSEADYRALRAGLDGLQGLAAFSGAAVTAALPEPRSLTARLVSANYFDVFGTRPALGRMFTPEEDRPARAAVAVISRRVWAREFNGDPAVVGRAIRVGYAYVTIVGVAPEGFGGTTPGRVDIWLPLAMGDRVAPDSTLTGRERGLTFVGRLKDGVNAQQIRAAAEAIATQRLAADGMAGQRVRASTSDVAWIDRTDRADVILPIMTIPFLVLTIACVNASTLLLARGARRRHELAIRLAIGAGRWRVVRQLVAESGLLALLAAGIGVLLAAWGTRIVGREFSVAMPIDATVLASTLVVTVICAVASGLVPALRVTADAPLWALRMLPAPAGEGGRRAPRGRGAIVAQIALSIGVLATVTQFVALVASQRGSAGTPADRLLMASFDLDQLRFTPEAAERFYAELAGRASRLPGVEAVGLAHRTAVWILGGSAASVVVWQQGATANESTIVLGGYTGADLFGAVGLRLLEGRTFVPADRDGPPRVAVVNDAYAKRTQGRVLGRTLRVGFAQRDGHIDDNAFAAGRDVQVIGVIQSASDPRYSLDGRDGSVPRIYLPAPLKPEPALTLYLRTRARAEASAVPLRELVHAIDARVPLLQIGSLEAWNARSMGWVPWLMRAATFMGLLALALTAMGLLAVVSYAVASRSREFAIRMALGSHPRGVLALVIREAMRLVTIGFAIGGGLALLANRLLQTRFHGAQGLDVAAFAGSSALLIAVMLLASVVPAIRASRVDPITALKEA